MTEREILRRNVRRNGAAVQIDKAIEEMAELTQALMKWRHSRGEQKFEHVCEEIADVKITVMELQMVLDEMSNNDATNQIDNWTHTKMKRIEATIL